MIVIPLRTSLKQCPKWWQNMIAHMDTEYPKQLMGFSVKSINKELRKLGNAKFIDVCVEYPNGAVIFKDESAHVMCMMRWK